MEFNPSSKIFWYPLNNCNIFHLLLASVPLPKGRLFSYVDTHRHRLGPNYHQIPVNCPFAARPAHYLRDGPMTIDDNQGMAGYVALALVSSRSVRIRLAQEYARVRIRLAQEYAVCAYASRKNST